STSRTPRTERSSCRYAIASSRLVLPWPFSPTSTAPESSNSTSSRSKFRKSRAVRRRRIVVSSDGALRGSSPPWWRFIRGRSRAAECGRALFHECLGALAHVAGPGEAPERRRLGGQRDVERVVLSLVHHRDALREREWRVG